MPRKKMTPKTDLPAAEALRSPEKFVEEKFGELRVHAQRSLDDGIAFAQLEPQKALLWALGAGYLLRMLPLTRIVGGVVGLVITFLKPAALIYGVSKLWHFTQKSAPANRSQRVS